MHKVRGCSVLLAMLHTGVESKPAVDCTSTYARNGELPFDWNTAPLFLIYEDFAKWKHNEKNVSPGMLYFQNKTKDYDEISYYLIYIWLCLANFIFFLTDLTLNRIANRVLFSNKIMHRTIH